MAIADVFKRAVAGELRLSRARIVGTEPDGRVRVRLETGHAADLVCDVLRAGPDSPLRLEPHAEVLVATSEELGKPGVILGLIGSSAASTGSQSKPAEAPDKSSELPTEPLVLRNREIVIEAGEELTFKCGDASIRITRDGRIVIRGEHLLSRARGTNRIKGGSVAIN